jgi:hypothetical protein
MPLQKISAERHRDVHDVKLKKAPEDTGALNFIC